MLKSRFYANIGGHYHEVYLLFLDNGLCYHYDRVSLLYYDTVHVVLYDDDHSLILQRLVKLIITTMMYLPYLKSAHFQLYCFLLSVHLAKSLYSPRFSIIQ